MVRCLVGVSKTTHARHHAEHVVVERIHADLRRTRARNRVERHRKLERRLVDTREVARAGRLVLFGAKRERVHADTRGRRARMVLVGLHLVEVRTLALREAVLPVELELGDLHRVLALAADTRVEDNLREEVIDARLELARARNVERIGTSKAGEVRRIATKDNRRRRSTNRGRVDRRTRARGLR